jgi:NADP-dependent 3-hydroxy acid dehydrogenase YdfG
MTGHLGGRVVVVTGAARGFGALVCGRAAALGANVVGCDLDQAALDEMAAPLLAAGHSVAVMTADVTDLDSMRSLASFAVDRFGAIDVIINNAGLMPLAFFSDHERAASAWSRAIDVNIKGVVNGIAAVYDQMIAQGRGHIVNVSSTYGNYATEGSGVYGATKAAVNVLSESLRMETQGKIKVTVVRPTGVLGTGLAGSIVNPRATVGMVGHRAGVIGDRMKQHFAGTLSEELLDRDDVRYWSLQPDDIADAVIHVIDQPWGVSISDITVRASGESYLL